MRITEQPTAPFIKTTDKKPYTLILDLDETLIHLKTVNILNLIKINDSLKGVISYRPGLHTFLDEVSKFYELVIFTCGTRQVFTILK